MAELEPRDLSTAGVFVAVRAQLALDHEVSLVLRSPIGELPLRGQVVQVISEQRAATEARRAGFGILFVNLGDDHRAFIALTLDALHRQQQEQARAANARATADLQAQRDREREETLDRLRGELELLSGRAPWEVLGVVASATPETVRGAFLAASKRYHPHVFARFDCHEISAAATELFIAHKRAVKRMRGEKTQTLPLEIECGAGRSGPPRASLRAPSKRPPAASLRPGARRDSRRVTKGAGPEER
ncbi:MAG: hypothetical protein ACHQ53_18740 [Polyangiales bacterium]